MSVRKAGSETRIARPSHVATCSGLRIARWLALQQTWFRDSTHACDTGMSAENKLFIYVIISKATYTKLR